MSSRSWSNLWAMLFGFAIGLMMCGTGHAEGLKEPVYPPYCWVQPPNSELWYQCDSEEVKVIECNNLMESAMRAVDPYVPSVEQLKAMKILEEPPETAGYILKLWDRAKNACWSDLKDLQPQHYH